MDPLLKNRNKNSLWYRTRRGRKFCSDLVVCYEIIFNYGFENFAVGSKGP